MSYNKLFFLILIFIFHEVWKWSYLNFVVPQWEYLGIISDNNIDFFQIFFQKFLSIIPGIFFSVRNINVSSIFSYFIMFFVYLPSIVVISFSWNSNPSDLIYFQVFYLISMIIIIISTRIKTYYVKSFKIKSEVIFKYIKYLTIAGTAFILINSYNSLSFIDFTASDLVAEKRTSSGVEAGSLYGYVLMLLVTFFCPFLLALSINKKKYFNILFVFFSIVILYSVAANKSFLFSFIFSFLIYLFLIFNKRYFFVNFTLFLISLIALLTYTQLFVDSEFALFMFFPSFLLLYRTLVTSGFNTVAYYEFFNLQTNDFTFLSHVKGFNLFINYPYENLLGEEVGYFISGDQLLNLNANFWISDGYSSFGVFGLIIISIFLGLIFWLINCSTKNLNLKFSFLCLSYNLINLTNISIFTSLLSGGLFLSTFVLSIISYTNYGQRK